MLSRTDTTPSKCQRESTVQEACKWRSGLSLPCCQSWSDNVMWLGKSDRSEQHLIWCCEVMSQVDYSSQLRKKRAFQLVQIQRRRPRTSPRTRVSETGAATASEPELLTIHITDNHTTSLARVGTARKRQAHFRSTEARGVSKEHCTRAAGPPPNKFSEKIAYL